MFHFSDWGVMLLLLLISFGLAPLVAWLIHFSFAPRDAPDKLDRLTAKFIGPTRDMDWKAYAINLMVFSILSIAILTSMLAFQNLFPLNPQKLPGLSFPLALNTAISFVTNSNWQAYSGEASLSYFSQMVGLGTQNFASAAVGLAVMAALARGIRVQEGRNLGNFWLDITRVTAYVLLPMSFIFALFLISQGVIQNFSEYLNVTTLEGLLQTIPMGPAASQVAIKQLGTNGGGFFGVNSAHPFENPTAISNFFEMMALLVIPAACPLAFGKLIGSKKHGWTLFAVMCALLATMMVLAGVCEMQSNTLLSGLPFFEGKEMRFGVGASTLWTVLTTTTSNGSANAMISSMSPLTGGIALLNILLGEVVFGGVGSGVYGMFLFSILTVFIAGLMVGRSPEFLGKKIEAREIRLAVIGVLLPGAMVLIFSALACLLPAGLSSRLHDGPHGLTEILYAFASAAGNNGSAFAGLNANTTFYNLLLGATIFLGRFGVILPILALAGLLIRKKAVPESSGTFPVSGGLFGCLLAAVLLIVGALTFLPALALGPIVEHLLSIK